MGVPGGSDTSPAPNRREKSGPVRIPGQKTGMEGKAMVAWLRHHLYARAVLAVVRIWVGWMWVSAGIEKIGSPMWTGPKSGAALAGFLRHSLTLSGGAHPAVQGWYAGFLRGVALPASPFFSELVSFGELLVGIALILGCLTTFAALMGAVMNTAYLLAGTTSTNPNMLILEMLLLTAGFNAGAYGLDRWVIPRLRKQWPGHSPKSGPTDQRAA